MAPPDPAPREADLPALPADPAARGGLYCRHLRAFVMPFWLRHGVDERHGGLPTCRADGEAVVSTGKYVWSRAGRRGQVLGL